MHIINNYIVENSIDSKTISTYVKCKCGEEILEFKQYHDSNEQGSDIFTYYLKYHGVLSKKDLKLKYSDFYFNGVEQVKDFCCCIENQIAFYDIVENDCLSFYYDSSLPENYIRKYGKGLLETQYDGSLFNIRKWAGKKYYNKNYKKPQKCSWELILDKDVALAFVNSIRKIIGEE